MFAGLVCGQTSVVAWVLMGLFWVTFVGLVLWALTRLFAPARGGWSAPENADDLDPRLAREQTGLATTEVCDVNSAPQRSTAAAGSDDFHRTQAQVRSWTDEYHHTGGEIPPNDSDGRQGRTQARTLD